MTSAVHTRTPVPFTWVGDGSSSVDLVVFGTEHGDRHPMDRDEPAGCHRTVLLLPNDTCSSYGFLVRPRAAAPIDDRDVMDLVRPDPVNPDRIHSAFGASGCVSVLQLPGAYRHAAWTAARVDSAPRRRCFTRAGRAITIRPGTSADVVLLLDGDLWGRSDFGFLAALDRYAAGRSAPTVVLVSTPDRHRLIDRAAMSRLLDDVLATVDPGGPVVVCGQSYGGHAAAGLLVDRPDAVAGAVVQSGSFWVDAAVPRAHTDYDAPGSLLREVAHWRAPASARVIVQAGRFERDMLRQSDAFADAAVRAGATVRFDTYAGGHDYAWYRHAIFDALGRLTTHPTNN